jgi:hypothetical protein
MSNGIIPKGKNVENVDKKNVEGKNIEEKNIERRNIEKNNVAVEKYRKFQLIKCSLFLTYNISVK